MELEHGQRDVGHGEEVGLHLLRDFELVLEAFLFALLLEEAFQGCGHAVEGTAERGELIVPGDLDAVGEIALVDGGGGFVEIADGLGDGAVEAHGHDECRQFEDSEENGDGDEHVLHDGSDLERSDEEALVEQRWPGGDVGEGGVRLAGDPIDGLKRRVESDGDVVEMLRGGQNAAADGVTPSLGCGDAVTIDFYG